VNKISSLLGAAAVIAIAVVFIVQFQPATGPQQDSGPACAAEIQGSCITTNSFYAAYYLLTYRGVDATRLRALGFRRQVADGLIETWLLNQDAKRLGITVSEDDVSTEIAAGRAHVSLPADKVRTTGYSLGLLDPRLPTGDLISPLFVKDKKTKKFDAKAAEKQIRMRTRLSPAEFREFQRQEIIASRMRELIRSRVRISESEAYEEFARMKATAQIDFVRLDRSFYADVAVDTSPKAAQDWADKNKEELDKVWEGRKSQYLPECRVTRHILVKVAETASDQEKAQKKERILRAMERINKGEDFADVARAVSEDTTALRGGVLGCVAKNKMVKPFEDAVFALEQGKLSDIVETQFGFHVLKVDKIAKDAEAEQLGRQDTALDLYRAYEAERIATEGAKNILAAVRGGKSLKDALDAHLQEVVRKKQDDDKTGKPDDKKAAAKTADDKKADDKADDKKADDKADEDKPLSAENHPARPTVETSSPFNAVGSPPIPMARSGQELLKSAFALKKAGDVPDDIVPLENGYAVFQLKEKTPATREQFDKERDYYIEAIQAAKRQDALIAYLKRLHGLLANDVSYKSVIDEPKLKPNEDGTPEPEDPLGE
jgi:peptidyl-prolyl cis-trans isomerase D